MIHARGLVQTFHTRQGRQKNEVTAVDGVDLDVVEREIVGFLGPNGAGKTTTLRMLTTLLKPTAGTATAAGYDVVTESLDVRRSIGYVSRAGGAFCQPDQQQPSDHCGEQRKPGLPRKATDSAIRYPAPEPGGYRLRCLVGHAYILQGSPRGRCLPPWRTDWRTDCSPPTRNSLDPMRPVD